MKSGYSSNITSEQLILNFSPDRTNSAKVSPKRGFLNAGSSSSNKIVLNEVIEEEQQNNLLDEVQVDNPLNKEQ
jgi:hypothetical protein